MKSWLYVFVLLLQSFLAVAAQSDVMIEKEIRELKKQSRLIQLRLSSLENKMYERQHVLKRDEHKSTKAREERHAHSKEKRFVKPERLKTKDGAKRRSTKISTSEPEKGHITSALSVHLPNKNHRSTDFHPSVLMAKEHVVTYIAGTPIVASPYLGRRPAFDGSDYIVNISSINADIRLMEQRRSLYQAFHNLGDPTPDLPIIALSGKLEPVATFNRKKGDPSSSDINLGSSELDVAAVVNANVEGYIGIAYDDGPPEGGGTRVRNSAFSLNSGFINIGNLDVTPWYFTAGQMYVPFGKYSSSMVSLPLTALLGKTKARPVLLGYKSQQKSGFYAAGFAFRSTTEIESKNSEGINVGYMLDSEKINSDIGISFMNGLEESQGMQITNALPDYFGGFASRLRGHESIKKVLGFDIHSMVNIGRYNFTAEWLTALNAFRMHELSFNGHSAKPSAGQLEASITFMAFGKPATFGAGYQWTQDALALNLPRQRFSTVFNISIWKNTIESLEYHHDEDYAHHHFANGIAPNGTANLDIYGAGAGSDSIIAQIGVYF